MSALTELGKPNHLQLNQFSQKAAIPRIHQPKEKVSIKVWVLTGRRQTVRPKLKLKLDLLRLVVRQTQLETECTAQVARLEIAHPKHTLHIKVTIASVENQPSAAAIEAKITQKQDQTLELELVQRNMPK